MTPGTAGSARLVCMFHMNLAFSSLQTEKRPDVIRRCYEPMLDLASTTPFPIAIEAPGWTLERIAELDPDWIARARELIADGRLELVGSSYAQCAAPLLPADVNAWNLRLGLDTYERLLGVRPRLALVCEQAYAPGLVELYAEAGYAGIIADWDNAYRSHHGWGLETRRYPQIACGDDGTTIPVIWSESIAFQKFQRFAHGEMSLDRYVDFVGDEVRGSSGALLLYANDAEVFDHRPGRFAAEPTLEHREWDRVAEGLHALIDANVGRPALPSELLELLSHPEAGRELRLEAASQPVPVKKQNKYNIGRWAVSGRDDVGINTRCWRIYDRVRETRVDDSAAWLELCALWSSDYRTHITESRWTQMLNTLSAAERRLGVAAPACREHPDGSRPVPGVTREGDLLRVRTGPLDVVLNLRRGIAIEEFRDARVGDESLFGTIEHGFFPTIELGADWYTGNLVQESPLRHKITDLGPIEPILGPGPDGAVRVAGMLDTDLGPIEKVVTVDPAGWVEVETTLHWEDLPPGSLRIGHVSVHPSAFDRQSLWYATHNGGRRLDRYSLDGEAFDHGNPVSALVSSNQGLGVTEGLLLVGDATRTVHIEVDLAVSKPLGLVNFQPSGDSFFLRAAFSLAESDDTRRGGIGRDPSQPQRFRFRLRAS